MNYSNRLLEALPVASRARLINQLEEVSLQQGEVLHRPGEPIEYVYFPLSCLLSITITMQNGATAETGLVGNCGMIGINAFMEGSATTQTTYVVQIAGQAVRLPDIFLRK
jgi:CRP-like cAMP-binding protein